MKKFVMTTIPLLCAAAAPLCADYGSGNKQSAADKKAEEQRMADQQWADQQWNSNHITPTGRPYVGDCCGGLITADFILWRAQEDGLNYAYTGAGSIQNPASSGKVFHPSSKYEPGFKLGAGMKFPKDGWDLNLEYTWLRPNNHKSNTEDFDDDCDCVPPTKALNYIEVPVLVGDPAALQTFAMIGGASSSWKLNFNVLDLELGRNFWVSKWLTLRPFIGMKFSWLKQRFNVDYNDPIGLLAVDLPDVNPTSATAIDLRMRVKEWGVGIRTGLDTAWYLWKHFAIIGELAFDGMWNHFKSKRTDTEIDLVGTSFTVNSFSNKTRGVSPILEWALGLRWETGSHDEKVMFTLQAAWEQQIWFNQNQFIMMPNQAPADLSMQGLTLKAGIAF